MRTAELLVAWLLVAVVSSVPECVSAGAVKIHKTETTRKTEQPRAAVDLAGKPADPLSDPGKLTVLIFLSIECPIANRYAPAIQRLAEQFVPSGVRFWLIYPDADNSPEAIEKHTKEYRYTLRTLRDPQHVLVRRARVSVTPEAAVFSAKGRLLYHGRIDDRFVDFGKQRVAPTQHDLREALEAALANKPIANEATRAVGCYISQ